MRVGRSPYTKIGDSPDRQCQSRGAPIGVPLDRDGLGWLAVRTWPSAPAQPLSRLGVTRET